MSSSIERADEALANASNRHPSAVDSLPATCRLSFEEVTSNSVSIFLTEISSSVVSFNIWCSQENEDIFSKGPVSSFLSDRRPKRIFISSLQPGTKYTFRAVAYGNQGEVGCSQAICSTKIVDRNDENSSPPGPADDGNSSSAGVERDCGGAEVSGFQAVRDMHSPPTTHGRSLDLNLNVSVPGLNEDGDPPNDCNSDGANGRASEGAVRAEDDAVLHGINTDQAEVPLTAEALDVNSALVDRPPLAASGGFDGNFGDCVKIIGHLERNGHIETEFGMKFLTWYTQRSTADQKQVVSLFIETFGDDDERLAKQLVDTYSDTISNKRPRH